MAMEEALIARLAGDAALQALVGDRISWSSRQRGDALPELVLTKISPGREYTHSGADGLDQPRIQFDGWAELPTQTAAIGRRLIAIMEQAADIQSVRFSVGWLEGERWSDEGEQDGGTPLHRVGQDFKFYHEEINDG